MPAEAINRRSPNGSVGARIQRMTSCLQFADISLNPASTSTARNHPRPIAELLGKYWGFRAAPEGQERDQYRQNLQVRSRSGYVMDRL